MKSRYRVGTLSAGLLFIVLGVGLLLQQWTDLFLTSLLFTWWPVLLILLGIEILVYLRLQKDETQSKLGYDIFSIFIILVFTAMSLVLYTVKESGLLEFVQTSVISSGYDISTTPEIIDDLTGIEQVILTGHVGQLNLISTTKKKISIHSEWRHVPGTTQEEAFQKVKELVQTKKDGSTLYISLSQITEQHKFNHQLSGYFNLELPHALEVKVDIRDADTSLEIDQLAANWNIDIDHGAINVWVKPDHSFNISAKTKNGNITTSELWDELNDQQTSAKTVKTDAEHTLQLTSNYGWIQLQEN